MAFAVDPNRTLSQYVHDSWGVERGFPNETVTSIAQTPDGYLWIGTDKSLIRFDGLIFQKFPQAIPAAFPIGAVQSLLSDRQGNLWILLPSTKLLRYHDGIFDVVRGVAENGVTALGSSTKRDVLISSLAVGTLSYNGTDFVSMSSAGVPAQMPAFHQITTGPQWSSQAWSTGLKPHRLAAPSAGVISIGSTDDGEIWLGTEGGELFRLKAGRISSVGNPAGARITSILAISNAELWIGTSKGLLRCHGSKLTREGVPGALQHLEILSLIQDRDANVWVGTNQGLMRVSSAGNHSQVKAMQTRSGAVKALFEDREGNIWIGGASGLERLRDSLFVTYSIDQYWPSAGAVYVDHEDRIWVAGIDGGLRWLEGEKQGSVTAAGLNHDIVYSIAGGDQNEIWLGRQRGGLTRLRYVNGSLSARTYRQKDGLGQDSVYAVYRSRNGTIWSGTLSGGVSAFRDGKFTTYTAANGLASNTISSIAEAADGTMWFGTPNGLSMLSKGHWRNYSVRDGLSSPDVNCLLMDTKGILWIGTADGLASLRAGKIQMPQNMPEPLHEPIFGMAEDRNGGLWIATASHILQVSPGQLIGNLLPADVREYTFSDGLQGKEGVKRFRSVIADSKGRVWFSTNRGLSVVDLGRRAAQSPPSLVHIVGVSADGNPFNLSGPLRVPPGKTRITFRFVGLSLRNAERVLYRYRLDEVDQGWSDATTSREASYGNLRPGSYRFHVLASNSDGIWNGQEAGIGFDVQPNLVQTWWFRAALLLCAGLVTFSIYQLRVRQLAGLLHLRFEERLAERTRIAQELHDTLLQSFQGLILRFQAASEMALSSPPEAKEALDGALERADQALRESREAIQGIRFESFSDSDIARSLGGLIDKVAADSYVTKGKRPTTSVVVEGRPKKVGPRACEEIFKIAREALLNAFIHGHAQNVELEIAFSKDFLRVRFRDDGVGIAPDVLEEGFREGHWGLIGMKERAERLRGRLDIWSKLGVGTEVEVTIPAYTAFEPGSAWVAFKKSRRGGSDT